MPYYPDRPPGMPFPPEGPPKRDGGRRRLIRLAATALAGLMAVYGSARLIGYFTELSASRETSRELRALLEEETGEAPGAAASAGENAGEAEAGEDSGAAASAGENAGEAETGEDSGAAASDAENAGEAEDAGGEDGIPAVLPKVPYPDNPKLRVSDRFLKLRRKGPHIIGWFTADGVDEAVVQKDNSFFLTHDPLERKNANGALFLDERVSLRYRPYTLYVFGHNMKSGHMFGRLRKYKENAYFYQHQLITFDTMYEDGQYAVFSVIEMDTLPGLARWYDLWALDTEDSARRAEAIRELERRSAVACALDVRADDQLLLMVTCMDGETERLVVAARRLRDGESAEQLTLRHGR